jgi:hypothetical protein
VDIGTTPSTLVPISTALMSAMSMSKLGAARRILAVMLPFSGFTEMMRTLTGFPIEIASQGSNQIFADGISASTSA